MVQKNRAFLSLSLSLCVRVCDQKSKIEQWRESMAFTVERIFLKLFFVIHAC